MIAGLLAREAERLRAERLPFVLATVVRAGRPTSVRPGDAALVHADGTIDGFVGGTCAEAAVRLHAARALETGEPLLLRLVPGEETTLDAPDGAVVVRNPCLSGGSLDVFLEPQLPAPRLAIIGEAPIARALEQLALAAGFEVDRGVGGTVDPRADDAAFVVASHGSGEEGALAAALAQGVPYVALVASPRRGAAVRAALDVPDELRAQLHVPAGLDIGARGPSEIAISILAQLVAERHAHPDVAAHSASPGAEAADPRPAMATAIDPVCGMEVAATDPTPHLDVQSGERVWFCCEGCRASFAAEHAGDVAER